MVAAHELGTSRRPDRQLAVVIGAGGLGTAVARRLGQHHRVLVVDLDGERAKAVARALCEEGGDAEPFTCDITRPEAVAELADEVRRRGGVRVLAHVAGLSPAAGDFDRIMRVNLTGPALVARALLPLASTGAAAIVIASLASHTFRPDADVEALLKEPQDLRTAERVAVALEPEQRTGAMAYQISKYGLLSLCRREAQAWGERGARIVSLSPGLIATPMGAIEFERSPIKREFYARTPLAREGTMLEIADAVEFLASDAASFISGTDLLVDGGLAGALRGD
ncbi:SDR family oxidoreductase [Streptomyces sp. NPDC102384]|uniref:SDR family oxidoreductase n=1 Tax=Streptomyces sp. NPDC102384 TaxID=3366166 RepID=UPI0037FACED0